MTYLRPRFLSLAVVAAIGLLAGGAWVLHAQSGPVAPKKQLYTCPMHPMVVQDHPGRCPICGMYLVPMKSGDSKSSATPSCPPGSGCCGGPQGN
jgi:hypothetical protein